MYMMTRVANMVIVYRGLVFFIKRGYAYGVIYREVWEETETKNTWACVLRCEYKGINFRIPEDEL